MEKKYWSKVVSKILKAELAKRDMSYNKLVEKLVEIDVKIKVEDLRSRVSRGNFSAALFIQCFKAMNIKSLPLDESYFERESEK